MWEFQTHIPYTNNIVFVPEYLWWYHLGKERKKERKKGLEFGRYQTRRSENFLSFFFVVFVWIEIDIWIMEGKLKGNLCLTNGVSTQNVICFGGMELIYVCIQVKYVENMNYVYKFGCVGGMVRGCWVFG